MNATLIDIDARQRTIALQDGKDHIRRAASAVAAATVGQDDLIRNQVLQDVRRRLIGVLGDLEGLQ